MLDAVLKALGQMFSRPFRAVLLKSAGLAIAFLVVMAIVLFRLLEWLSGTGVKWLEVTIGPAAHGPLAVLGWIVAVHRCGASDARRDRPGGKLLRRRNRRTG